MAQLILDRSDDLEQPSLIKTGFTQRTFCCSFFNSWLWSWD